MDSPLSPIEELSNDELNLLINFGKSAEFVVLKKLLDKNLELAKNNAIGDSPISEEGRIDYGYIARSGQRLNIDFMTRKVLGYPKDAEEIIRQRKEKLKI